MAARPLRHREHPLSGALYLAPSTQIAYDPAESASDFPVRFGGQRSHTSHVLQNAVDGDGARKQRAHR
jgi:hypothetical protein